MDMSAIGMAMAATQMASQGAMAAGGDGANPDVSFAQMLNQVLGGGTQTAGGTTQTPREGMTWRDIQQGMMLNSFSIMRDSETPLTMDPVLAQLLNMLKGSAGEGEALDIEQLIAQMQDRLREILEEDGAEAAGQNVLALMDALMNSLTGMGLPQEAYEAFSADGGAQLTELMLENSPKDIVAMLNGQQLQTAQTGGEGQTAEGVPGFEAALDAGLTGEQMDVQQPGTTGAAQNTAATAAEGTTPATPLEPENAAAKATPLDGVEAEVQAEAPAKATAQNAKLEFGEAVRAAAQQTQQSATQMPVEQPKKELTIEELQQRVDSGAYLQNTALAGTNQSQQVMEAGGEVQVPVATQVQQGITAGLADGRDEFSITLRPAELGDITVRMRQTDAGMMVDIIAKNPETQKILAQEIAALKQALTPLNVDVENVMTEQQANLMASQQGFEERQQRWRDAAEDYAHQNPRHSSENAAGVDAVDTAPPPQAKPQSNLDAYI